MAEVEISILGKKLILASDADEEYVREVANFVNERIENARKKSPAGTMPLTIAILGALDVADEYFKARGQSKYLKEELEKRIDDLIKYIEEKLGE